VWKSTVDGRVLHFRLAGINNQNFIMRDEETGGWWQQISGQAFQGPLKGKQLEWVAFDEMSFALWKQEHQSGQVLLPDAKYQKKYAKADWELRMLSNPTVTAVAPNDPLKPRSLIIGIRMGGVAKAYPMQRLLLENPIIDTLASKPILMVAGSDGRSVRAFERMAGGKTLDLYLAPESGAFRLMDAQTGSLWDFSGRCVQGPLAGKQLQRLQTLKDYWFDWKLYNPQTLVYRAGRQRNDECLSPNDERNPKSK
jgi:Protein of unknown function (DUF3179)